MSNSSTQARARHLPNTTTAPPPPSCPTRIGPSILINSRSEGSLTTENYARRQSGEELTDRSRRTSFKFAEHPTTERLLTDLDAM